jgi:hypothetical protein
MGGIMPTLPRLCFIMAVTIWLLNFSLLAKAAPDTIITSQEQLESIYQEIQGFIYHALGGIKIDPPPLVKLADKDEIQFKFVQDTGTGMEVIGFYQPFYPEQIYVLGGYSRIRCASVLCHEYTHAWQSRNCPLQEVALREGFATWVEYKYLFAHQQYQMAQTLRNLEDPDYREGLTKCLVLEARLGIPKLIEWVKTAEKF